MPGSVADSVLLIGPGGLGGAIAELLARDPAVGRVIIGARDTARAAAQRNLWRLAEAVDGFDRGVEVARVDLDEPGRLAEVIEEERPTVVLHAASLLPWWWLDRLPEAPRRRLRAAGFAAWLPIHLALALRFGEELREAAHRGASLMAPYPDVVCPVLARVGTPATCGIGNVDEIAVKLRLGVAERLEVPIGAVIVRMAAHHALLSAAFASVPSREPLPPFLLRVTVDGSDVGDRVDLDALLRSACPLPEGPAWNRFSAASGARLVRALAASTPEILHAPGPRGLPGGYPVRVAAGTVEPIEVEGHDHAEAVAVNEASQRFDGVERIADDGSVFFTETTREVLHDELGYDCGRLLPAECRQRAEELIGRCREYAARHGVELAGNGREN